MNANRQLWEQGDFTRIAETMRHSGEDFVAGLGLEEGMEVLDLGCGDGTTAIPAGEVGARVVGVDIAANLVAAGKRRAKARDLRRVRFVQGDARDLAMLADARFDVVISVFGAMFAPDPLAVAREMVRVTKPGGRIVMGNWIPGDSTLVAQILRIGSTFTPPPPEGFVSPMAWGNEETVRQRFGEAGISPAAITCTREEWRFCYGGPPDAFLRLFRDWYGPTMNAYAAARAAGREEELHDALSALFVEQNRAEEEGSEFGATYLRVEVMVTEGNALA